MKDKFVSRGCYFRGGWQPHLSPPPIHLSHNADSSTPQRRSSLDTPSSPTPFPPKMPKLTPPSRTSTLASTPLRSSVFAPRSIAPKGTQGYCRYQIPYPPWSSSSECFPTCSCEGIGAAKPSASPPFPGGSAPVLHWSPQSAFHPNATTYSSSQAVARRTHSEPE